jgi:hypothetical protein
MSVASTVQGLFDRTAKIIQGIHEVAVQGTDSWTRADAAGNEDFENAMKGENRTDADTMLQTAASELYANTKLKSEFTDLTNYVRETLGLGAPYIRNYVASLGIRVPYGAALALIAALGSAASLLPQHVFPRGTLVADEADPTSAGMHEVMYLTGTAGASTETVVAGALPTTIKGAAFLAVNTTAGITATDVVLECTLQDRLTTIDVPYDHDQATIYTQGIVGVGAVGVGGAASGQKDVLIKTAISQFTDGEWVLLMKADRSVAEVAQIASSDTLTLTMESNLINSWLEDDLVLPWFTDVTLKSGSISDGDVLRFYALPDRIIAL